MIGPVVVDASVVVEYLVVLRHSAAATRFFGGLAEAGLDRELWAPDLVYPEVVSALRKLVRLKAITAAAAKRAVGQLTRLPLAVTGSAPLMASAWELRDALTTYDATYVALAQALGVPLVTTDLKLTRWSVAPRVPIVHVDDADG